MKAIIQTQDNNLKFYKQSIVLITLCYINNILINEMLPEHLSHQLKQPCKRVCTKQVANQQEILWNEL